MSDPVQMPATSSSQRGLTLYVTAGCALLVVCAVFGAAIAGWQLFIRSGASASQPAVEYVLDASSRMAQAADTGGGTRLVVAQAVLDEMSGLPTRRSRRACACSALAS